MLTSLGQALAKLPPIQLAATHVMVPREFVRSAVQDAVNYMINQLAFADKVWPLPAAWHAVGTGKWLYQYDLCLMHDGISSCDWVHNTCC